MQRGAFANRRNRSWLNGNKSVPTNDLILESDRNLLRSILQKDNDRIREEMRDAEAEVVFKIGFEGGGFEVKRFTTTAGKEYFITSGTNMTLDENDDDYWVPWENAPTASFEGSLAELGMDKNILYVRPLVVHPDYRETIGKYIEKFLSHVTSEERERMEGYVPADAENWFSRLR
jgi:hypothetical protein